MAIEIERRFLVVNQGWEKYVNSSVNIRQGYLSSNKDECTIRVRIFNKEKACITIKSMINKLEQHEFEYLIPLEDAEKILQLTKNKLKKKRYHLNLPEGDWIVDCFEEDNNFLVLAEVELKKTAQTITKPEWCGLEITGLYHWSNAALARKPINQWSTKDRLSHPP